MSEGIKKSKAAGGVPAIVETLKVVSSEMGLVRGVRTLLKVNQLGGVDCPGCAWPEPDSERSHFEFCENGAKHVADEAPSSPDARIEMGAMIDRNNQTRSGFKGPGIAVSNVYAEEVVSGKVMNLGNSAMTKEEAKRYLADHKKWEANRPAEIAGTSSIQKPSSSNMVASNEVSEKTPPVVQVPQTTAQPQSFTAPSQASSMISPSYSTAQTSFARQADQSCEELRQYLSEKNDAEVSRKTVSALDDPTAEELNRLRTENQSLLEQQLKDGQVRLKELEARLTEAAAKVPEAVVDRKIASVDEEVATVSEKSSGLVPRSIDQRVSSGRGISGSVSSGGSQSASGGSSSNIVSRDSSVSEVQEVPSVKAPSDSGSIVITASNVQTSEALPAKELNQEVQKYLASSDLSSTSIEDIKSKGIKIRFNVMENDKLVQKEILVKYENLDPATRNQIDFRLARKNVSNQVSKLSVLRMLIKQNQRL